MSTNNDLRVLVVGASIAGPTAAYWLSRTGAQVTVIERFPELREGGQNIDIRSVGVTVMRRTPGMEAAVKAKLAGLEGIALVDTNDKAMATMLSTGDPDQQSLVSEYEIFRGDLSKIIYSYTKDHPKVKYVFNEQVVAMHQDERQEDGPLTVEFMNGYPTQEYDLVVACDGSTSRTRAIGLNCGPRDYLTPMNMWCAYWSIPKDMLQGDKVGHGYCVPRGRMLTLGPDPDTKGNRCAAICVLPRKQPEATLPFRKAREQGTEGLKNLVKNTFQGIGWKSDEILKAMAESDDFYASEMVQIKCPSLSKGRFVMVGDAGCAPGPTGTGTSLAMGGAYVLAGEIGAHKGDVLAGLRAYEDRMKPIIAKLSEVPPGLPGIMAPWTSWGLQIRNMVLIVICWLMSVGKSGIFSYVLSALGKLANLFSNAFGKDEFDIPEYQWEQ